MNYFSTYIYKLFILCLLLIITEGVSSQQISHLGVENGINGRQVFNIVQDNKKFVWISTRFGVDRFDGANIKNYPMNILHNGTIPIRSIKVGLDRDFSLWAYTDRGTIYKYDNQRDEFVVHIDLKLYIRSLFFDADNNILVATRSDIGRVQGDTIQYLKELEQKSELYRDILNYDKENILVVSTGNIYKYNINTKNTQPFIDSDIIEKAGFVIETCLYDSNSKKLWIGTVNKGVFVYDIDTQQLKAGNDIRLWYHPVLSMNKFDDEHMLIGTEGVGLCLLNIQSLQIDKMYTQLSESKDRISGNAIYDIYKDTGNKIWLSTFSDGINILDFSQHGFRSIKHEEGNANSLSRDIVCDILEDSDRNLWFATDNDLCFWNRKTNKWKRLLTEKNVMSLYEDSHGNIWAGTYSSGVFKLNKQGSIIANYIKHPNLENSIGTSFVYAICEDSEGNIWFGGKRGNTSKLNLATNSFTHVSATQANHIVKKDSKHILVSTEHGVYQISTKDNVTKECTFNKNLKSKYISDMYLESDSVIWLATYGDGLNRCNMLTGGISSFTEKNGLPSDIVYAIEADSDNNLWFSSENGIGCFNLKSYQVTNFSVVDGISGNRFRQLSKTKSHDGDIYFGSYNGVTFFDPRQIHKTKNTARLSLQGFSLFNQIVKPGDKNSPLKQALDDTKEITLNYRQHSFSVDFVAVDYSLGKSRRYMWKLENMDQNWVGPTAEHIANYTNLSPNDYVFKVKYLDDNSNVLDEREVKITVSPPFWNTAWARIIMVAMVAVIVYLVYRYVEQQMKKKQSEEKIRFFINTAHDIRTPLTLISGPIYELKEQIEASPKNDHLLTLVTENLNKLNKMFSQLLDFQKAYESKDQLVIRQRDVKKYLEKKFPYWKSSANKKEITLILELPLEDLLEWFDIEKMDRILDNLVSNAIKYTPQRGHIDIKLSSDSNNWQISVMDNGIGISKQDRKNLFTRFYRASNAVNSQVSGSGLGLLLVEKYVTLHKGNIGVNSVENQGSEFYVQFKRGKKHYQDNIVLDDQNLPVLDDRIMSDEQANIDKLKIKLLVVEDNNDLRSYLELSLSHYYKIYTAENGAKAWNNILRINPDIVVSDLQMPEMSGFELCEKIKNTFETSHIPVILLTVVNDKQHVIKGFNLGVDDYIEKPFDVKYLRLKIDNIIQNRKILRQKFLGIDKEQALLNDQQTENEFNAEFIRKATSVIENNITNPTFSISDFSKEMGLSRTLLYTKFNSVTGYTPNDFMKIVRMNKAIEYFKEKKYTINEVALMVGFEEPAYFSTSFKKIYGKSPKQFIEENIS
ncbi:hybrid sensor histidine kinase/response regulator transcription factor [Dysgonomonas sp. BGC7]|uniref:hybrid sensor histidine kinase/response regulator transcription factor n=1 Tax=Dysgonomonas sp. BGC7 TaxID=1658008 RepID=UPI0006818765|nr:hybrid sensor histidine kinase/response regulator transcription factor [Dysgonomonas sp. BGC7]MBD8387683.1 response regulator [Dysgonomonas sp. BGC7]